MDGPGDERVGDDGEPGEGVVLAVVDARDPDARAAVHAYFTELDERFPGGFDPGDAFEADAAALSAPTGVFVVARAGDAVVGCGGVQRVDDATAEIKRMWVHPTQRGRGLSRRLLGELEDHARRLGHRRVVLDTNGTLTQAIRLYETSGYEPVERYNDNPYAQRWFAKDL